MSKLKTSTIFLISAILFGGSSMAYAAAFQVATGGTGWTAFTANTILLGNGTSRLATTTAGANGQYLMLFNSVPTWVTATSSASIAWGAITGTLSNQLDLNATFSTKLGTSSSLTQGQVTYATGFNTVAGAATTTLSGGGPITVSNSPIVLGSSGAVLGCATCNTSNASVSSIVAGTGLNGGTITTTGRIDLKSYFATSTADVVGQLVFFSSNSGTPATLGASSTLTFIPVGALFSVTNASTTNVTASQSSFIASKQVNPYQNATFAYGATTTWSGTTTETKLVAPFAGTFQDTVCVTDVGTLNVQVKVNSTNVTPMFNASTTKGTVTFTGSNTFVRGDTLEFDFGTPATAPRQISCTPRTTVSSF